MIDELDDAKDEVLDAALEWHTLVTQKDFMPEISEEDAKKERIATRNLKARVNHLKKMQKKYRGC